MNSRSSRCTSVEAVARAIVTMQVRGAPLIGATAAYGVAMALRQDASDEALDAAIDLLAKQRPTAINLRWALEEMRKAVCNLPREKRVAAAYDRAAEIADEDVETCRMIGVHGLKLIREIAKWKKPGERVNVLTHCNAGWLACVDWGTATSPIYLAHDAGIALHVWVDETRPRNQGAALTAFELGSHGVPHTIVVDNAGGHLMQHGEVDLCIVGTDRVTAAGDVANKIGTYLKALAARDNGVPFYVALPHSTIDWTIDDGRTIPIEERSADEVLKMPGRLADGSVVTVEIAAPGSPAGQPGVRRDARAPRLPASSPSVASHRRRARGSSRFIPIRASSVQSSPHVKGSRHAATALRTRLHFEAHAADSRRPSHVFAQLSGIRLLGFRCVRSLSLIGLAVPSLSLAYEVHYFEVPKGDRPHDVAPAPDGTVWYTGQGAGVLGRLDPANGHVERIPLGESSKPHGVIVGPDGAPWVTDGGLNAIVRVDPASKEVKTWPLPKERADANLNTAAFDGAGAHLVHWPERHLRAARSQVRRYDRVGRAARTRTLRHHGNARGANLVRLACRQLSRATLSRKRRARRHRSAQEGKRAAARVVGLARRGSG